jgi:hypothetical protein
MMSKHSISPKTQLIISFASTNAIGISYIPEDGAGTGKDPADYPWKVLGLQPGPTCLPAIDLACGVGRLDSRISKKALLFPVLKGKS